MTKNKHESFKSIINKLIELRSVFENYETFATEVESMITMQFQKTFIGGKLEELENAVADTLGFKVIVDKIGTNLLVVESILLEKVVYVQLFDDLNFNNQKICSMNILFEKKECI